MGSGPECGPKTLNRNCTLRWSWDASPSASSEKQKQISEENLLCLRPKRIPTEKFPENMSSESGIKKHIGAKVISESQGKQHITEIQKDFRCWNY